MNKVQDVIEDQVDLDEDLCYEEIPLDDIIADEEYQNESYNEGSWDDLNY